MLPYDHSPLRVVVDTNVLVRGILSITGGSALVLEAIKRRRCILVSSSPPLVPFQSAAISKTATFSNWLSLGRLPTFTEDDDLHEDPAIRFLLRDYGVQLVHVAQFLIDLARISKPTPEE